MPPPRPPLLTPPSTRPFSTTPSLHRRPLKDRLPIPKPIPPYPHGPRQWYKQANRGLYGTLSVRTGHNVSAKNEIKTPRTWRPNVQTKRLWSEALNRWVRVRLVMRVLKTIDKVGGLDNYLLGSSKGRIRELGMEGWALRWRLWRTEAVRERMAGVRERMGLVGKAPWERAEEVLAMIGGMEKVGVERDGGGVVGAEVVGRVEEPEEAARRLEREIDERLKVDDEAAETGGERGMELNGEFFEEEGKKKS